ncbi:hypothetical protein [Rhodoplanes sp. Z2-YC6860]|nr:hypothetical protein [Rhodoplanes sp. Z2-YC6860]
MGQFASRPLPTSQAICAAIISESMSIDFITPPNVNAGSDLYLKRADFLG